ncbi:AraC family transcriptional regulator [Cupriavidus basilensis]
MGTTIRSALLVKFSETARTLGVDAEHMIQHVGADRTCLASPDLHVPEPWLANVLEASEQAAGCPSIGVLIAESWRLSDFGPISLLVQFQPTLRHALGQLDRYRHLISESTSVSVDEGPDVAVIHLHLLTERPNPGRQPVELSVGTLFCLIKTMLGPRWRPRSVHFSHAAPATLSVHQRYFGANVEFGSDFDGILLDRRDLDQPNPLADVNLARYAKEYLDQVLVGTQSSTATNVRRAVHLLLPKGRSNIDQVCQQLGMSSRTLQRRLEQEGQDFTLLVNDVRRSLASRYLSDRRYPVSQVAMLLGFSEVSTFSRWFSTQFGKSPSHWRADLLG